MGERWIEFAGVLRPVDKQTQVEVRLADGEVRCGTAGDFNWGCYEDAEDIVAYRTVPRDNDVWLEWG